MKLKDRPKVYKRETWSLTELGQFCHADANWVITLVDNGALSPVGTDAGTWRFTAHDMRRARKADRLAREFQLNDKAVGLVLNLLDERNALARKLAQISR